MLLGLLYSFFCMFWTLYFMNQFGIGSVVLFQARDIFAFCCIQSLSTGVFGIHVSSWAPASPIIFLFLAYVFLLSLLLHLRTTSTIFSNIRSWKSHGTSNEPGLEFLLRGSLKLVLLFLEYLDLMHSFFITFFV